MSYKFTKGSQVIGDLKAADDTQRDTLIDFGEDTIELQTSGSTRLKIENNVITTTTTLIIQATGSETPSELLSNESISFYLDEDADELKVRVKYSDGQLKTGTIGLS